MIDRSRIEWTTFPAHAAGCASCLKQWASRRSASFAVGWAITALRSHLRSHIRNVASAEKLTTVIGVFSLVAGWAAPHAVERTRSALSSHSSRGRGASAVSRTRWPQSCRRLPEFLVGFGWLSRRGPKDYCRAPWRLTEGSPLMGRTVGDLSRFLRCRCRRHPRRQQAAVA